jgi:hypothetical protein
LQRAGAAGDPLERTDTNSPVAPRRSGFNRARSTARPGGLCIGRRVFFTGDALIFAGNIMAATAASCRASLRPASRNRSHSASIVSSTTRAVARRATPSGTGARYSRLRFGERGACSGFLVENTPALRRPELAHGLDCASALPIALPWLGCTAGTRRLSSPGNSSVRAMDPSPLSSLRRACSSGADVRLSHEPDVLDVVGVVPDPQGTAACFARLTGAACSPTIATVSSEEKAERARAGGADHVIDYRREDVAARVLSLTGGLGVHHVVDVDFGDNLAATLPCLRLGGSLAFYASKGERSPALAAYALSHRNLSVHGVYLPVSPHEARRRAQADISRWIGSAPRMLSVAALSAGAVRRRARDGGSGRQGGHGRGDRRVTVTLA